MSNAALLLFVVQPCIENIADLVRNRVAIFYFSYWKVGTIGNDRFIGWKYFQIIFLIITSLVKFNIRPHSVKLFFFYSNNFILYEKAKHG